MLIADDAKTSDRELARIVVEMFEGTGLPIVVAFSDTQQALKASKKWTGSFSGRIIVLGEKRKREPASSKAFKKPTSTVVVPKKSAVPEDAGRRDWCSI